MIIEYSNYDISSNDAEIKEDIILATKFNVSCISVLPQNLKTVKTIITNPTKISTPIDFPMGISDLKTRLYQIEYAAKSGADKVDVLLPTYLVCNRKYEKLKDDIKCIVELATQLNISVRYILEYRVFTYETLYKITQILITFGITEIFPSSGYMLDNISDNILASIMINKKVPNINIICNGNVWYVDQIDNIIKNKIYGLRVNSINALKLVAQKMSK